VAEQNAAVLANAEQGGSIRARCSTIDLSGRRPLGRSSRCLVRASFTTHLTQGCGNEHRIQSSRR
jgi:hypothetical protein